MKPLINPLLLTEKTYRELLRLSFGHPFRLRNQALYAALRDALATELGQDHESVQNRYEASGNGVENYPDQSAQYEAFRNGLIVQPVTGAAGQD